jgi:hypothetical protein
MNDHWLSYISKLREEKEKKKSTVINQKKDKTRIFLYSNKLKRGKIKIEI